MKINSAELTLDVDEREIIIPLSLTQLGVIIKLLGIKVDSINETATMYDDRTLTDLVSKIFDRFKEV